MSYTYREILKANRYRALKPPCKPIIFNWINFHGVIYVHIVAYNYKLMWTCSTTNWEALKMVLRQPKRAC
jgi:hypothetical protein